MVLLGRLHDLAQGQSTSVLFIVLYELGTFGPTLDSSIFRKFTAQIWVALSVIMRSSSEEDETLMDQQYAWPWWRPSLSVSACYLPGMVEGEEAQVIVISTRDLINLTVGYKTVYLSGWRVEQFNISCYRDLIQDHSTPRLSWELFPVSAWLHQFSYLGQLASAVVECSCGRRFKSC